MTRQPDAVGVVCPDERRAVASRHFRRAVWPDCARVGNPAASSDALEHGAGPTLTAPTAIFLHNTSMSRSIR